MSQRDEKGSVNLMRKISNSEAMSINGGKTYKCIDCNYKSTNFWTVYWHCLSKLHFKSNRYLYTLYRAGSWCFTTGLQKALGL